jgi:hypothetical protein
MTRTHRRAWLVLGLCLLAPHGAARAETIDFGTAFQSLPYSEDGVTFTNLGTSLATVGGFGAERSLAAGTNDQPIRVRATSPVPFDLVSLDFEQVFQTIRIESSLGGLVSVTFSPGTINFASVTGFQGINYFEIIHDPPQANGGSNVDNIVINFVPEPGALALLAIGGIALLLGAVHRPGSTAWHFSRP